MFSVGPALVGTLAGISPSSGHDLQSAMKLNVVVSQNVGPWFSHVGEVFTLLAFLINSLVGFLFGLSTFVMF